MSKFCFAAFVAVMVGVSAYAKEQANKNAQAEFPKRVNANAEILKMFDKDGDGKLNDEERAAMREQMRKNREKKFDTNGDGKLDEKERAAMQEARKTGEKKFDTNGDGKLDEKERAAMQEARKTREKEFDKDGDGKLSDEERKAMRETLIKRHQGKGKAKGKDK